MQDIFKKYVEKHHLTEKEALQLLNTLRDRTSIEELRQRLQSSSQKQESADLLAIGSSGIPGTHTEVTRAANADRSCHAAGL